MNLDAQINASCRVEQCVYSENYSGAITARVLILSPLLDHIAVAMRHIATHVALSVCLCVCWSRVSLETSEPLELPFGVWTGGTQGTRSQIFTDFNFFSKLQARTWLFRAFFPSFSSVLAKRTSARDNHVLACNFAKYSPILKYSPTYFFYSDSAINLS